MTRQRHHYSQHERELIFLADKIPLLPFAICRICNKPVSFHSDWEVAHEISVKNWPFFLPASWRDSLTNVGVAHKSCNRSLGPKNMSLLQSISLRWKLRLLFASSLFFFTLFCLSYL